MLEAAENAMNVLHGWCCLLAELLAPPAANPLEIVLITLMRILLSGNGSLVRPSPSCEMSDSLEYEIISENCQGNNGSIGIEF
ncbi:hypothetical protein VNO78_21175 [Psophocarpus tetragonolobus]|uniref:Uncharacterized protein n=1 Tax=Psophocarpus tetragonolobus TaxID=3891 RepID=A0AAN9SCA3_PSOTE